MKKFSLFTLSLAISLSLAAVPVSYAETTKIAPEASEQMLKTLAELETQLGSAKNRKMLEALKAFEAASASGDKAYNLWIDCKKSVDFDEKGKTGSEWGEWKRTEGPPYHDNESTMAMQHQLKWLCLTLKACMLPEGGDLAPVVTQIPTFIDGMLADWKRMKKFSRTLRESALESPFAKFYKLDQIMQVPDTWSRVPGDLEGLYKGSLIPHLKTLKNLPALQTTWTKLIGQVTEIYEIEVDQEKQAENDPKAFVPKGFNPPNTKPEDRVKGNAEERQIVFKKEGLPRLQWQMQVDSYQLGAESASATAMLSLIRNNLGHPDAAGWLGTFQALLKGEPLPTEILPGPAPGAAPAPAEAPGP